MTDHNKTLICRIYAESLAGLTSSDVESMRKALDNIHAMARYGHDVVPKSDRVRRDDDDESIELSSVD